MNQSIETFQLLAILLDDIQVIVHDAQHIREHRRQNVKISNRKLRIWAKDNDSKGVDAYLVVSLCSTPMASMIVVVYSIPVVRLFP